MIKFISPGRIDFKKMHAIFVILAISLCLLAFYLFFGCGNPTGGGGGGGDGGGGITIYKLGISITPEGWGTVEVSPTGEVTAQGTREYVSGTSVTLLALPDSGKMFSSWEGAGLTSTTLNPSTVEMTANRDIKAYFVNAPAIGDPYQGGKIAYIYQPGDPGYVAGQFHGLIAATSDQSSGIRWYNGDDISTGASEVAVGTGQSNTAKIIAAQGEVKSSYAAGLCDTLSLNGYDDWFLPSREELYQLYLNRGAVGGFSTDYPSYYWSSTEISLNSSTVVSFYSGSRWSNWGKNNTYMVRAIRAF